jgi:hypothetical protein
MCTWLQNQGLMNSLMNMYDQLLPDMAYKPQTE